MDIETPEDLIGRSRFVDVSVRLNERLASVVFAAVCFAIFVVAVAGTYLLAPSWILEVASVLLMVWAVAGVVHRLSARCRAWAVRAAQADWDAAVQLSERARAGAER